MLFKFDNEQDWLDARKQDVTSTEAAALFGLNPYKSRLRLWKEKAGVIEDNFEESPFTIWGRRLQTPIGLGICEDEAWEGFDLTGYYLRDPEVRSGASLDMKVICRDRGVGNLEIKVAESFSESQGWGENRVPIWYEFQMQMQMNEAKKHGEPFDFSCLGTLGRRQSVRLVFRELDQEFSQLLDNEIKEFWRSIEADLPPEPDYTVDGDLLAALAKPVRMGEGRNLSQDNRAVQLLHEYKEKDLQLTPLKEQIKTISAEKKAIQAEIHAKMGNAETAIVGPYIVKAKEQNVDEKWTPPYNFRRFDVSMKR